ncbi:hypothetical protein BDN72DRAFT_667366 [Pluteus cervinus]|uniref:Uncharacterized protein n=1 Tax=Pluteus cervinus TaxID=181527 RepID=A0ACD3B9M0_9AGAR|nr:hypothetical protein BDN72DRAFT_667366 [Pluteus cervinus]
MTTIHHIPAEIWDYIVQLLSYRHQRNALSISKKFHELARRYIFRSLRIYLVTNTYLTHFRDRSTSLTNSSHDGDDDDDPMAGSTSHRLMRRSWELLKRIINDPGFASLVKELAIVIEREGDCMFELFTLKDALACLHHLEVVHWYSGSVSLSSGIASAFPTSLRALRLRSMPPFPSVMHLSGLRDVQFVNVLPIVNVLSSDSTHRWGIDHGLEPDIQDLIQLVAPNLARLVIPHEMTEKLPMHALTNLTELEVVCLWGSELKGLDLLLRHLPNLRGLVVIGEVTEDTILELPLDPTILPQLSSFRLQFPALLDCNNQDIMCRLCIFLSQRQGLRRLFLTLEAFEPDGFHQVFEQVCRMYHLRALGFLLNYPIQNEQQFQRLVQFMPSNLRAIHLAIDWRAGFDLGSPMFDPLLNRFAYMPKLTFVNLDTLTCKVPIDPDDIAGYGRNVEMVGVGRSLWDVERTEEGFELLPRAPWQSEFPMKGDFVDADHEWVYRYH